jgi:peptidoglycan/xylan/chitin deacetylase (PgdA/CDA1 family)
MGLMERLCSVSIDLDPIACYYRIHSLGKPPAELDHVVLERGLPRWVDLLATAGIRATFFVVGGEVDKAPALRAALAALAAAGHELANHSYRHPYDMARLDARVVADEIGECDRVLREITGAPPVGFRAPGYDVSPVMMSELARRGYRYDSSIFPAPVYYAAKAAVMAGLAAAGRPSGAVMTNPRALVAPTQPYWPAMTAPWRRGQGPVIELPVAVTPGLRVPAIGTSILVAPAAVRTRVVKAMRRAPFWNFELHGIDLCDAEEDGIPGELVRRQPDLRIPIATKRTVLAELLAGIAAGGARFVPLREAAEWAHRHA